jgi:DNA-binding IscR family transcriptional regulator
MFVVGKSYRTGAPVWTLTRLAQNFDIPGITLGSVVHALEHAGLVVATEDDCLLPGRDMHTITLAEILQAVRRRSGVGYHATARTDQVIDDIAAGVERVMLERIAGRTLADLVSENETPAP